MQYNNFKNIKISALGFGGMRFPKKRNGKIDFEQAAQMIDYAYKNGVNYFDTAYMYHDGESETFFGETMQKYPRDSFYLADKMPSWLCKSREDVAKIFDGQLAKCKVDYFDFYLVHSITRLNYSYIPKFDVVKQLLDFKEKGQIKYLGFSFHGDLKLLKEVLETYPNTFEFVQLQINYYDWLEHHAKEFYDLATAHNLPIIVMEPVKGGTLATLSKKARDIFIKAAPDNSIASWAIRFASDLDNVFVVLSGMSNMEQTVDNIKNLSLPKMTEQEHTLISAALNTYKKSRIIPCTGCRYCMECVKGIDIPLTFSIYNEYRLNRDKKAFISKYHALEHKFADCIACRKCVKDCPQGIDIPKMLEQVSKKAKEGKVK